MLDAYGEPGLFGSPKDQWRVWCFHCRKWHFHGSGDGHRWAHCWRPNSPYDDKGYVIRYVGERVL